MALIPLFSKGIIYDTDVQAAQVNQVVERAQISTGLNDKCVVVEATHSLDDGYTYTLISLDTFEIFSTRMIFDEQASASGVFFNIEFPTYMMAEKVAEVYKFAIEKAEEQERINAEKRKFLHKGVVIVEYTPKSLAIFTTDPNDEILLNGINAKRNQNLTFKGQKVAGWIFPKYRQEQLADLITLTPKR